MNLRIGILLLFCVSVIAAVGQETKVTRAEAYEYFRASGRQIAGASFRDTTNIFQGDTPNGPWKPYSSWINLVVPPDRSHLTYTSGRSGDFINIGRERYARANAAEPWVRADDGISNFTSITVPSSPSNVPGDDDTIISMTVEKTPAFSILRIVTAKKAATAEKDKGFAEYFFDEKGILTKKNTVFHNGFWFVRRIEVYEYNPEIKIEAPIK